MIFRETSLSGAFLVDLEPVEDERGFFARSFCRREFEEHGLASGFSQASVSYNRRSGTLRGLHYQAAPHAEDKLVRCTAGAIYDVIVDLRPGSTTRLQWLSFELDAAGRRAIFVPKGFAHGFLTLRDATEVSYQMSTSYVADAARGIRFDDPALAIVWPRPPVLISERDRGYPDLDPEALDG